MKKFNWLNASFSLVMAGCAFLCFVVSYIYFCFIHLIPVYFYSLLLIIPCLIFLFIGIRAGRESKKTYGHTLILIILVPILALTSIFYIFYIGSEMPITNYKYYQRIIAKQDSEIFDIFPRTIPKEATNISFYYEAGGFVDYLIEARLKFTASEQLISNYQETFSALALSNIMIGSGIADPLGDDRTIPDSYQQYVFIDDYFKTSLVLIDEFQNTIIFYGISCS